MRIASDLELMQIHVNALYTHDENFRIRRINERDGGAAPRFWLGRTKDGNIWRYRYDLHQEIVNELEALCMAEPKLNPPKQWPRQQEKYETVLGTQTPIQKVVGGPTYWFAEQVNATNQSVEIDATNAELLQGGLEDWVDDISHRRPFFASLEDEKAVALCTSSRITDVACEAGVETLPGYRQRGHACRVVADWANALQSQGVIAMYSTSWDNIASQAVASKLRLTAFGAEYHIS